MKVAVRYRVRHILWQALESGKFQANLVFYDCRLTRTLSTPKRCITCNKMVYFTGIRCKQCGNITHESCATHSPHWCESTTGLLRRNSHQPELEEKTDEADDGSWRYSSLGHEVLTVSPFVDRQFLYPTPEAQSNSEKSPKSPTLAVTGLLKVVHWLSQRRRNRENISKANAADKHVKSRFGLHPDKTEEKFAKKKLKALMKTTSPANIQRAAGCTCPQHHHSAAACHFYRKASLGSSRGVMSPNGSLSSSGYISSASSAVQTPSDTELDFRRGTSHDSRLLSGEECRLPVTRKDSKQKSEITTQGRRQWLTKARTLSIETKGGGVERLCATWPPAGRPVSSPEDFLEETESGFDDAETEDRSKSHSSDIKERLGEWCIPYKDLEFKERLRHGCQGDIFRGRWHGEVLIYTFHQSRDKEVKQFWEDVNKLCMIRHENIALFMGACIEPPQLAIITSMKKGPSLFEHIHIKKHHLSFHTKLNIARQIAQGMGYLHAKGIIHKNLTSKNVILESRVKVCIMDQGMAEKDQERLDYGCISRGHLSYLSPELIKRLKVDPPHVRSLHPSTHESDIYAFGSVLFELVAERFPFHSQHPHSIIWQVATGRQQKLDQLDCTSSLKTVLQECWSENPGHRPSFISIGRQLAENVSLHKRHSSSEPDRLHRMGLPVGRSNL